MGYVAEVLECKSSRSGKPFGVVRVAVRLVNQDGVTVQEGEDTFAVAVHVEEN